MQTFLPYPDFVKSAKVLDYRRLGKQRVEAQQILNVLQGTTDAWKNHPAVKMWRGYENALIVYRNTMIEEWMNRGYNNTMLILPIYSDEIVMPKWFGDKAFHAAHRSSLLRKDPVFYGQYKWTESSDLEYVWPV